MGRGLVALMLALAGAPVQAETWALDARSVPFDYASPAIATDYQPLQKARQKWRICVAYPHLKDAYWLGVNYGMVQEATQLGVGFRLVEAGGYPNLDRQIEQVKACVAQGADALIVGTVSMEGLTPTLIQIAKTIPVIAAINDIADAGITAKSGVSWREMGFAAAELLIERVPEQRKLVTLDFHLVERDSVADAPPTSD